VSDVVSSGSFGEFGFLVSGQSFPDSSEVFVLLNCGFSLEVGNVFSFSFGFSLEDGESSFFDGSFFGRGSFGNHDDN